jgi:hypothetical protein
VSLPRKSDIRPWWTEAVAEIQNAKETLFIANQHSSAVRLLMTSHVEQLTVLFLCWENSTEDFSISEFSSAPKMMAIALT